MSPAPPRAAPMLNTFRSLRRRVKRLFRPRPAPRAAVREQIPNINSLEHLLPELGLARSSRVLDVGGSAFDGEESTDQILEHFNQVDVILAKPEHEAAMVSRYGDRIRLVDSEVEAASHAYDLIIVTPVLSKIVETVLDANWRFRRLLKPGGHLITFGIDPAVLDEPNFKQPESETDAAFRRAFGIGDGTVRLPASIARHYELVSNVRRRPAMRSYVTWLTLRLRADAPDQNDFLSGIGLSEGAELRYVLNGLATDPDSEAVAEALTREQIDTLMVVDNQLINDSRVTKTLETVRELGRKVLGVGLGPEAEPVLTETRGGAPVLLFPNPRAELDRRLRTVQGPLTPSVRHELKMAVLAANLEMLLQQLEGRDLIVHSHDFQALYAVGEVLRNRLDRVRWVHDVHEYIADYGIIDESVQRLGSEWEQEFIGLPHVLTGVSEEQCQRLAQRYGIEPPRVLYNAPRLANRHRYRGPSLREALNIEGGHIVVHSGSVRPGRGVDHVVRVLPQMPDAHLVLLTQSTGAYLDELQAEAETLGVAGRLHVFPAVPSEEVTGLLAGADVGLIPMDSYGNSEMSLPNKFFDYVFAGIPVLSSDTGSLTRLMSEWPVGELFPRGDEASLSRALASLLSDRDRFSRQICSRPDLLYRFAWERQAVSLMQIYTELQDASFKRSSPARSRKAATAARSGSAKTRSRTRTQPAKQS